MFCLEKVKFNHNNLADKMLNKEICKLQIEEKQKTQTELITEEKQKQIQQTTKYKTDNLSIPPPPPPQKN